MLSLEGGHVYVNVGGGRVYSRQRLCVNFVRGRVY